ncbi:MAG: 23S rRNA pseudouridine(1911/1915/1917) synthase RluD [Burkholderiales bacterium]|nr:23S rRNA pseudouridine(1911/1915/1917) synthase RluD [Burkholderiales bacterium]
MNFEHYTFPPSTLNVPEALAGQRLDQALAALLPQHSRSRLKQWIEAGYVRVDGRVLPPKTRLAGGERLDISAPPPDDLEDAPQAIGLAVVYEDDALLVIDKPAGLTVHPGAGNRDGTLLNALLHHDAALTQLPRAGIVHRLDKDTSGLMVVARNETAHTDLVRQLQARTVKREYLALVFGNFERSAVVEAPIGRHPTRRTQMAVVSHGKPARTHVSIEKRFGFATLVRCTLDTGRTHQIRVHLTALGHPLVGDPVYRTVTAKPRSSSVNMPEPLAAALRTFPRQALHATRLGLEHPVSRKPMQWNSPLPDDFSALLALLEGQV